MCSNRVSLKKTIANRYGPEIVNKLCHLEFLRNKVVRLETSITFLTKCRDWDIIPTCCRIKPRSDIQHSEKILRNASVRLLRQTIRNNRCSLDKVQCDLYDLHLECSVVLSVSDFELCDRVTYFQARRNFNFCTEQHENKFQRLLSRVGTGRNGVLSGNNSKRNKNTTTVINLTNSSLDDDTQSVLEKGLDFALTPKQIPYEDVISSVEETIIRNKIPPTDAESLRQDVSRVLRNCRPPKPNVTAGERLALRNLRENQDLLVLKADKGNATVVMYTEDYDNKIRVLLSDTMVYKPVSYNPTARVTRRIRAVIHDCQDLFPEDVFQRLHRPAIVQPPKLYGLPKIHKVDVPLRPIVSQIDSPTYRLAKHVAGILQPYIGRTPSFVKDSRHFVSIIKDMKLEPYDIMVSFDVESLFTNVPLKDCLNVVRRMLNDHELPDQYVVLLENCLDGNFFLYQGQYYLQIDGVAMGSPVAPALANIWMEHFEQLIDWTACGIKLWKRYVDDVFCILDRRIRGVDEVTAYLNSVHPRIKFTYELEENRTLAFLDIKIMARPDGTLSHTVYRKPTHTDRYLNAASHHHPAHLQSVVTTLTRRAHDLCDPEHLQSELQHVQEVLKRNGYRTGRPQTKRTRLKHAEATRQPAFLPYVKGVTDKIGNLLRRLSIKSIYTPLTRMAKQLRTPKDVIPLQMPGVYKVDCSCGHSYIGQTKRTIAERVKEHIAAVKNRQINKSAIAEHLVDSGLNHWIELHDPKVIANEPHYYKRIIREAIEIRKYPNFNREDGFKLSAAWNPVITYKCSRRAQKTKCQDTVSVVCQSNVNAPLNSNIDHVRVLPTLGTSTLPSQR